MAIEPLALAATSKSEPNRQQSNWTRHLNQSKSIRLRRVATLEAERVSLEESRQQVAASLAPLKMVPSASVQQEQKRQQRQQQQQQNQRQLDGSDLGRVSINHVGVVYDGERQRAANETAAAAANTSGIQNPMISSVESKSSKRKGRQQHLKTTRNEIEIATTTTTRDASHRIPLQMVAVMVASIVCCTNLIGHCNCDTSGGNPFSGSHSGALAGGYAATPHSGMSSAAAAAMVAAGMRRQARESKSEVVQQQQPSRDRIAARDDRPAKTSSRKNQMEELLRSMAESIERQHAGLASGATTTSGRSSGASPITKPSKFDSSSRLDASRETSSNTRHDDFLRDILASHERKQPTSKATSGTSSSAGSYKQPRLPPATSKADQELRQIMLMHEHSASSAHRRKTTAGLQQHQQQLSDSNEATGVNKLGVVSSKWAGAKLLAKLQPKDLILKANLVSSVPKRVFSSLGHHSHDNNMANAVGTKATTSSEHSTTSTTTGSPFTPRANAKNYFMGPILGLGQMLMAQPKPTVASRNPFSRNVAGGTVSKGHSQNEQPPNYSQPANEYQPTSWAGSKPKKSLSPGGGSHDQQTRRGPEMVAATSGVSDGSHQSVKKQSNSNAWQASGDAKASLSSSSMEKAAAANAKKNGWLVDGATQMAQTYFKDSFRDLLTLTQLPIFSGGPVSTAPSDLEPGGKKWLAQKQAAEQGRGNKTSPMEELLRYVYILGNVGVRRKRDPLKVLGGPADSTRPSALSSLAATGGTSNRRPLLSFLANRPITSLIKFPPPKTSTGSKLSSFLIPNSDHIKSRGVMWDMATDPTLAVTMFHLLERASVALPLGFLLMPAVHMIRNPLGGLSLGRILPARASHRSVELEELAKRLDMMDKILSRSLRSTHRDASFIG